METPGVKDAFMNYITKQAGLNRPFELRATQHYAMRDLAWQPRDELHEPNTLAVVDTMGGKLGLFVNGQIDDSFVYVSDIQRIT